MFDYKPPNTTPPMHGPACPSTKYPIPPHRYHTDWDYMILLLFDPPDIHNFLSGLLMTLKLKSSSFTSQNVPFEFIFLHFSHKPQIYIIFAKHAGCSRWYN